jgi:hypothetical protein
MVSSDLDLLNVLLSLAVLIEQGQARGLITVEQRNLYDAEIVSRFNTEILRVGALPQ